MAGRLIKLSFVAADVSRLTFFLAKEIRVIRVIRGSLPSGTIRGWKIGNRETRETREMESLAANAHDRDGHEKAHNAQNGSGARALQHVASGQWSVAARVHLLFALWLLNNRVNRKS
jgi:hypothetical protein